MRSGCIREAQRGQPSPDVLAVFWRQVQPSSPIFQLVAGCGQLLLFILSLDLGVALANLVADGPQRHTQVWDALKEVVTAMDSLDSFSICVGNKFTRLTRKQFFQIVDGCLKPLRAPNQLLTVSSQRFQYCFGPANVRGE